MFNKLKETCYIWGSHRSDYGECHLLGHDTVWCLIKSQTFLWNAKQHHTPEASTCISSECGLATKTFQPTTINSLIPCSRVLLAKVIVAKLLNKFPVFYVAWMFITMITTAPHWSISWLRWIKSTAPSPYIPLKSILMSPSHIPGLHNGQFPSGFSIKILYIKFPSFLFMLHTLPFSFLPCSFKL